LLAVGLIWLFVLSMIIVRQEQGDLRWAPRFFLRRLAWHAVDHAWEIEDRIVG